MSGKVVDKDSGYKKLKETLEAATGAAVRIGVQGEQDSQLVMVASVHEFGSQDGRIPQRSYLRSTFDEKKGELEHVLGVVTQHVIDGKSDVQQGVDLVGEHFAEMVRAKIRSNVPPPLRPSTLKKRLAKIRGAAHSKAQRKVAADIAAQFNASGLPPAGSVVALIDTGRLIQSIRAVGES